LFFVLTVTTLHVLSSFPTRRSSDLIVLVFAIIYQIAKASELTTILRGEEKVKKQTNRLMAILLVAFFLIGLWGLWYCHDYLMDLDRKSTRLNSSHVKISYAVFCLKK